LVLCLGMGGRAAEALHSCGIETRFLAAPGTADEVVAAYVAGTLPPANGSFCRCSH
jgi:predicted Fe-Mo cluster-binding NifX family protein